MGGGRSTDFAPQKAIGPVLGGGEHLAQGETPERAVTFGQKGWQGGGRAEKLTLQHETEGARSGTATLPYAVRQAAQGGWQRLTPKGAERNPIGNLWRARVAIHLHKTDLPDGLTLGPVVAIDTETMGLDPRRDRLCVVQLSDGSGDAHLVQIAKGQTRAPNLEAMLADPAVLKLFHYGRFDIAMLKQAFGVTTAPVWCTKIASKLVRTFTDRHGLKYLLADLVAVDVSKQQQTSDWGSEVLTDAQKEYAASDVLYLHALKRELEARLAREGRLELAQRCFDFLPTRAELDLMGWDETHDIYLH